MKKILYLSVDGLLDPLGQSQIFPYIDSLSKSNLFFFVCTIENKNNKGKVESIKKIIEKNRNIHWEYFFFSKKKGKFNRLKELVLLYYLVIKLVFLKKIDILHSRSYLPMFICALMKLIFKKKLIFDTRGSWFDERIEGGMLQNKGFDLLLYKLLKKIEFYFFRLSDHIIFLTNNGSKKIQDSFIKGKEISIIPCAADYDLFKILNDEEKKNLKKVLGFEEKFIITYSGSIGSWYNFDQIINFFSNFLYQKANSHLIILTQSNIEKEYLNLPLNLNNKITFMSAKRRHIPDIIGLSDLTLSFIKNTSSKIFSSPTKIAESLGCGVPVVYNNGIGDLDQDMQDMKLGFRLDEKGFINSDDLEKIIFLKTKKSEIRENSFKKYSLENAVKKYIEIYKNI